MSDDKELLELLEYKDDKIRKLQKESTKLRNDCKMFQERYHGSLETQKRLEEENKLLKECAEFYANSENWAQESEGNWYGVISHKDISSVKCEKHEDEWGEPFADKGGKLARQTLTKIKGDV